MCSSRPSQVRVSLDSLRPLGRSSSGGGGEWTTLSGLMRQCLLWLPPQVLEGRFLQSGMGMGGPGSKLGALKLKFIRLFVSFSLLSFLSF